MARDAYSNRFKVPLALSLLEPHSRVIDIGCGPGRVLLPLVAQSDFASVVGVDTDAAAIESLNNALEGRRNATAQVGNAEALPFDDRSFDVALCYSTVCMTRNPEVAIAEIARVLKPGGRAVIDIRGSRNVNNSFWRDYYAKEGIKLSASTLPEATDLLKRHGFHIDVAHASGLTRAAYYLPVLRNWNWIERVTHSGKDPDLDFTLSNIPFLNQFAATWYFVVHRQ